MTEISGMLAMVTGPALRAEVDRVAAAVGARVIHITGSTPVSRRTWCAATAVVLDQAAATRCAHDSLPRRGRVIVVADDEPGAGTWQAAIATGAERVLILPAEANELVRELADAGEAARDGRHPGAVLAVVGGRGGAGASLFATALARAAGSALLIDLDPWGGGLDLLVGSENLPGLRWPDLAVQRGRLTWPAVREALPRHRGISVLSATRDGGDLDAGAVAAVIDAGRGGAMTVICDLPRVMTDAAAVAVDTADLVVMVSPCDVRACAASAALAPRLRSANPNVGLVVRGPSPAGLRATEVAEITGLALLASMRAEPRLIDRLEHGGLRAHRRSALTSAARRVLAVLPARPGAATTQAAVA